MSSYTVNPVPGQGMLMGAIPDHFVGKQAVDGTAVPWSKQPVGTHYLYKPSESYGGILYIKRTANSRTDDWSIVGEHCIQQRVSYSDFTDGLGASGTLNLTETIPVGAYVTQTLLMNLTGFTGGGESTCVLLVGESGDTDRYSTGTPSIFTTANAVDMGVPSGTKIHTAGKTVLLTATSNSDWTLLTAGAFTIRIYFKG